jgi:DNA-binding GntR family transcriptional regulator
MKTNSSKLGHGKKIPASVVLDELRTHLINGHYVHGERLLETRMAETYGVSRGTIRSVLQELSSEGLVEFIDSGSCVAVGINEKTILDIYDLRRQLELKAADIILQDTNNLCLPLVKVLANYDNRHEDSLFKQNSILYTIEFDLKFHEAFMFCSQNRPIFVAWCSMAPVIRTLLSINVNSDYWISYEERFYTNHKTILDYAITKDSRLLKEIERQISAGVENSVRQFRTIRGLDDNRDLLED